MLAPWDERMIDVIKVYPISPTLLLTQVAVNMVSYISLALISQLIPRLASQSDGPGSSYALTLTTSTEGSITLDSQVAAW